MKSLVNCVSDSVTSSGNGIWNEDALLYSSRLIGVLDGATPINSWNIAGYNSSAEWLVSEFVARFNSSPIINCDFGCFCQKMINELSASLEPSWKDYDKPCFVSATASYISENTIQIEIIGDCSIYVKYTDGRTELFTDNRIDTYANKTLYSAVYARNRNVNVDEEIKKQKIKNREMMNIKGGYWVVGFRGCFTNEFVKKSINISDTDSLLICTDGFARAFKEFKIVNVDSVLSRKIRLADVLNILRRFEDTHYKDNDYPCVKKSDDASAILLHIKKGDNYEH